MYVFMCLNYFVVNKYLFDIFSLILVTLFFRLSSSGCVELIRTCLRLIVPLLILVLMSNNNNKPSFIKLKISKESPKHVPVVSQKL